MRFSQGDTESYLLRERVVKRDHKPDERSFEVVFLTEICYWDHIKVKLGDFSTNIE